jgi:hypothetical protein
MLSQDLIVAPTQGRPPALIECSGRKARDRIEHFLRAAIDNDNTRRAYGRALGSFFAFLEDGGRARPHHDRHTHPGPGAPLGRCIPRVERRLQLSCHCVVYRQHLTAEGIVLT